MLRIAMLALASLLLTIPASAQNTKSGTAPGQREITPGQSQTSPGGAKELAPPRQSGDTKDNAPGATRRDTNPGATKKN